MTLLIDTDLDLRTGLSWSEISPTWRTTPKSTNLPRRVSLSLTEMGFEVGEKIKHVTTLGAYFFPSKCDSDFSHIFMAWFFEIDDEIDEARRVDARDFIYNIKNVCQNEKEPVGRFELITKALCSRAKSLAGNRVSLYRRFIADLMEWLDSINPAQERVYDGSYRNLRLVNVGAIPTLTGGEILLGFNLSTEFTNNVYVQMLRLEVCYHIAVVNDIVSLHQDVQQGKTTSFVTLMDGDTLTEKRNNLFGELKRSELKMKDLVKLLLATTDSLPDSAEAKADYTDYCREIVGGHVAWALSTGRYDTDSVYINSENVEAKYE